MFGYHIWYHSCRTGWRPPTSGITCVTVRSCRYVGPIAGLADASTCGAEKGSAEDLKWAEVAASTEASGWRSLFEALRPKLLAAIGEVKEARRAARDTLALPAELVRLHGFLADGGGASGWPSPMSIPARPNGYSRVSVRSSRYEAVTSREPRVVIRLTLPMRAIWRLRSRSAARAGAVQACVRAIACRSSAEGDTPAAAAFSFEAACSARVTWAATTTVRRSAMSAPARGFGGAPVRALPRQRRAGPGVRRGGQHRTQHRSPEHSV